MRLDVVIFAIQKITVYTLWQIKKKLTKRRKALAS